jgi:hypothetical protein
MPMKSNSKNSSYLPSHVLAGFGTVTNWFRCRGVIGPVPQPLWIRNIIQLKIKTLFFEKEEGKLKNHRSSSYLSSRTCWIWHRISYSAAEVS